jgi:regulator of telomere elongation helicase 1
MEKVVTALSNRQNALLESPTGTGKTLCLLCAVLAVVISEAQRVLTPSLNVSVPLPLPTRIIYSSRTHSQLSKVISELKSTSYSKSNYLTVSLLGSRQQLCIHPTISTLASNSTQQNQACHQATKQFKCQFHNNLQRNPNKFSLNGTHSVMDLEDLISYGRDQVVCPYYLTRQKLSEANLILMPYNYLLDPTVRKKLDINLENSVIIFDEAHNIESVASEAASFDLTALDLAQAITEVQKTIELVMEFRTKLAKESHGGSVNEMLATVNIVSPLAKLDVDSLLVLKSLLLQLEEIIEAQPLESSDNNRSNNATHLDGCTRSGDYIFELLNQCRINWQTKNLLMDTIEKTMEAQSIDSNEAAEDNNGFNNNPLMRIASNANRFTALNKFVHCLKLIFSGENLEEAMANSKFYRVHIHKQDKKQYPNKNSNSHSNINKNSVNYGRTLSYWCFSGGISMLNLSNSAKSLRSVILTSGTLSPLDSFALELRLPFHIKLENPHIIKSNQIWLGIVDKGPRGNILNSNYNNRQNEIYLEELGSSIINWARIIPHGLLVFFPSYSILQIAITYWTNNKTQNNNYLSTIEKIEKYKATVIEPKQSKDFQAAMEKFHAQINLDSSSSGCIFFAVCRGKVSEGLDFADKAGRAVLITGIPYPALNDAKVILKRQFLDENIKVNHKNNTLSGSQWYSQEACRAINQAIGRVIRHKEDYGAIILADQRFLAPNQQNSLSAWLRPQMKIYESFALATQSLANFFKSHNNATATNNKTTPNTTEKSMLIRSASNSSNANVARSVSSFSSAVPSKNSWSSSFSQLEMGLTASLPPVDHSSSSTYPQSMQLVQLLKSSGTALTNNTRLNHNSANAQEAASFAPAAANSATSLSDKLLGKVTPPAAAAEDGSDIKQFLAECRENFSSAEFSLFRSILQEILQLKNKLKIIGNNSTPQLQTALINVFYKLKPILQPENRGNLATKFLLHLPNNFKTLYNEIILQSNCDKNTAKTKREEDLPASNVNLSQAQFVHHVRASVDSAKYKLFKHLIVTIEHGAKQSLPINATLIQSINELYELLLSIDAASSGNYLNFIPNLYRHEYNKLLITQQLQYKAGTKREGNDWTDLNNEKKVKFAAPARFKSNFL